MSEPWYQRWPSSAPQRAEFESLFADWALVNLAKRVVACGGVIREREMSGRLKDELPISDNMRHVVEDSSKNPTNIYVWGRGILIHERFNRDRVRVIEHCGCDTDREAFDQRCAAIEKVLERNVRGRAHVLARATRGFEARDLGEVGQALIQDNYTERVVKAFDRVEKNLQDASPPGRLTLIHGPPGTGKTYFLRSLMSRVDATFLLVKAEMAADLDGPQIVPLLMELHDEEGPRPTVLVMEDADDALLPRGNDNMSRIRALLNYSDGILGTQLNLHVIATTNAKKVEIEDAFRREGRLAEEIEIGPLSADQATRVLQRLRPDTSHRLGGSMTLAQVYALARKPGLEKL